MLPVKHMRDYQEKCDCRTDTHGQTDAGQSDPYVPLCFAGDTNIQFFGSNDVYFTINKSCQKTTTLAGRQPSLNRSQG